MLYKNVYFIVATPMHISVYIKDVLIQIIIITLCNIRVT